MIYKTSQKLNGANEKPSSHSKEWESDFGDLQTLVTR